MGQRGIGLVEQDNGQYNAFYTHWLPVGDVDSEKLTKEYLIGDKGPVEKDISKEDARNVAVRHDAMTVFVIDKEENVEFMSRDDL